MPCRQCVIKNDSGVTEALRLRVSSAAWSCVPVECAGCFSRLQMAWSPTEPANVQMYAQFISMNG